MGEERAFPTGLSCPDGLWIYGDSKNPEFMKAAEKGEIKYVSSKHSFSKRFNISLQYKRDILEAFLSENRLFLSTKSVDDVKEMLKEKLKNPEKNSTISIVEAGKNSITLIEAFKKKMDLLFKGEDWGNYTIYKDSLNTWVGFLKDQSSINDAGEVDRKKYDIELIQIDKNLLNNFVQYCKSSKCGRIKKGHPREGMKPNSISIRLRCLRHLINTAIDDKNELISYNDYPFRGFRLPSNKTVKRAVKKDIIEDIRLVPLNEGTPIWHHRNFFLFMFNNQGMNFMDVALLKRKQIQGNRLQYARTKTRGKAVFDIELTEESIEILQMYGYEVMGPEDLVFPIVKDLYGKHDSYYIYSTYKNRIGDHNSYLKELAKLAGHEVILTSYVARHSWASEGFREFESIDLVGQGLGHSSDPKVTKLYAEDLRKDRMDDANKIITQRKNKIATIKTN